MNVPQRQGAIHERQCHEGQCKEMRSMQNVRQSSPSQGQVDPHEVCKSEQKLEQWTEFLTPAQRQQIVAGILATIALRVVRNERMTNDRSGNDSTRKSH